MGKNRVLEGVLLLTVFIWGINTPIMKVGLLYVSPVLYNTLRMILAAVLSWPILWYSRTYKPVQKGDGKRILAVSLFGFFFCQLFLLVGLPQTTAGNASLMMALLPISVVIINKIFKNEAVSLPMASGIIVSLLGAILVILGSDKKMSLESGQLIGTLLILLGQIGNGYYTVFSKDLHVRYSTYQIITYILTISALVFSVLAIPDLLVVQWREIPPIAWISISYSSLLALLFGNYVWIWTIGRFGSTRASLYQNLIPIFSIISAWIFLGEVLEWLQCVGISVIFIGLYLARTKMEKISLLQVKKVIG